MNDYRNREPLDTPRVLDMRSVLIGVAVAAAVVVVGAVGTIGWAVALAVVE